MRVMSILVGLGLLSVGVVHSAAAPAGQSARIAITKVTIDAGGTARVKVAISGFSPSRGHWDLKYTLLGKKPAYSDTTHVRRGTIGQTFTNFQSGERWRLAVLLVDNDHTKVFARSSKVVRAP
jgi:hypothetical protein